MESLLNEYYKPVLKWAGGKRQLLPALLKNIPDKFITVHDCNSPESAIIFSGDGIPGLVYFPNGTLNSL